MEHPEEAIIHEHIINEQLRHVVDSDKRKGKSEYAGSWIGHYDKLIGGPNHCCICNQPAKDGAHVMYDKQNTTYGCRQFIVPMCDECHGKKEKFIPGEHARLMRANIEKIEKYCRQHKIEKMK